MANEEETGSPWWSTSFFMQTTEDVARAVAAATTAVRSPSKDDNPDSQLQKLQRQVTKMLKGFSNPSEVKKVTYNPEILTSQKRQWENFQLQYLDHRSLIEPTRLFESIVVAGLHPDCDTQELHNQYVATKSEGSGKLQHRSHVGPSIETQVLFVYPPEKQLPLKYKDLLSFCFPGGVEVHAVERTPSMSELSEILLGQEHLKQSGMSFVFRLQVADDSTLYGCCMLVEELVQKPSGLISMLSDRQPSGLPLSRHILTTRRCYCILSRLPLFELHFGVLNSILTEERLDRLTKDSALLDLEILNYDNDENKEENVDDISPKHIAAEDPIDGAAEMSRLRTPERVTEDGNHPEHQELEGDLLEKGHNSNFAIPLDESEILTPRSEPGIGNGESCDIYADGFATNKETVERRMPNAVLPLLRYYQYDSSDSSSSFQGSPSEERHFRSDADDTETEEASSSGQEDSADHTDILEWAKENNHGSLRIICEYYRLHIPARGSTLRFHPLEHLHPLKYDRPDKTILHTVGSTIDLRSCSTGLELPEPHNALMTEEEATSLSIWAVACLCGSLGLENVLTIFAGALLEKQIIVICSNLGILSASVLSIIPLIRPYRWQSLLMPVLPNDMLDFLDAPVPYIVGVKNKTSEVQSKLASTIMVDADKNQVKALAIPKLPQHKELLYSLSPHHSKLVGESYLARKRPVHECSDVQIEAAKGFLTVLRSYLDNLCSNLRSHTITNVQLNNDKVSLLLKESFLDSFPSRDRPFMKLFVDTQLFSVHTDRVLSFYQKD